MLTISKLLLKPTQENEAAIGGLAYIMNVIMVYKWQEKTYSFDDETRPDFENKVLLLYTSILEYEAKLLVHLYRKPLEGWAKSVFGADDWKSHTEQIKRHDTNCREVTNAIAIHRTRQWQVEERDWYSKLLQQPREAQQQHHL